MKENINEEKLQEMINECIIPGSSIGVHGITQGNHQEKANSILNNGLNMSNLHPGLTGTIKFLDADNNSYFYDILKYSYAEIDENGNSYTIICAIPDVIEDKSGVKYYLGKYTSFPTLGKDDHKSHLFPTHDLEALPTEFIVGCLVRNYNDKSGAPTLNFILNENYIGLKDEDYKTMFFNKFLHNLLDNPKKPLPLNESGYQTAKFMIDYYSVNEDFVYYYKLFMEKYESLMKSKKM